ncbi:RICIN domain-containing protein [uncultured Marinobacter sp.]|uniref:RICIN domain-containing protein n=1 Tax=uncultured Marinobacter sp. TaxID=187379 RepID=UPI0030DC0ECF
MDVNAFRSTGATLALATLVTFATPLAYADVENGRYYITSRHSGLVLDVSGRSTADGANVVQWEQVGSGNQNQQFDVNTLGNGYYSIRPAHSGKSLDLFNFSTEAGGEIRQWSWNGGPQQQWRIEPSGNGYYKILSRHSGMALDVWEWSRANGGDIRQWPDTGGANQQWQFQTISSAPEPTPPVTPEDPGNGNVNACLAAPVGYATLNGGTTGGAGGQTVTVRNGREFMDAIKNKATNTPLTIRVDGTINLANSGGTSKLDIKDVNNVSVIGVGSRALLDGIGIKIWRANNVIVRNLTIRYVREGDGDAIGIQGPSSNIWIDHNTLYNSLNVDKDYYDGLIDTTRNANNISITYNHLHSSWKTSLTGHTDNNSENNRRITYAFNHWDNVNSRTPLIRHSDTHIYNNYYNRILDSGINSRMGAQVRIDNNVFENSKNPIMSCYSNQIGYWDTRNNQFNNITWDTGSGCVLAGSATTPTTLFNPPYQYDLLATGQVKNHVVQNAGAGRCNL